ncbi:hypothetical protein OG226_18665 [Streptomyces sp. NBC_01261]|uniref:hypothetical protein n=1 Tax=Streptomyces sp. NBC_01261 TaxID=2903802 RepID=UPI002E352EF4|nr:hypothetical protein [Streptomyces sp. NBC_01261]
MAQLEVAAGVYDRAVRLGLCGWVAQRDANVHRCKSSWSLGHRPVQLRVTAFTYDDTARRRHRRKSAQPEVTISLHDRTADRGLRHRLVRLDTNVPCHKAG